MRDVHCKGVKEKYEKKNQIKLRVQEFISITLVNYCIFKIYVPPNYSFSAYCY